MNGWEAVKGYRQRGERGIPYRPECVGTEKSNVIVDLAAFPDHVRQGRGGENRKEADCLCCGQERAQRELCVLILGQSRMPGKLRQYK